MYFYDPENQEKSPGKVRAMYFRQVKVYYKVILGSAVFRVGPKYLWQL